MIYSVTYAAGLIVVRERVHDSRRIRILIVMSGISSIDLFDVQGLSSEKIENLIEMW